MNQLDEIKNERRKVATLLGGQCVICLKKFGKGFNFHHIKYKQNEKIHADFNSWLTYNRYILPRIIAELERFALLCKTCHRLVSIMQAINNNARFERLVKLTRDSRRSIPQT